METCQACRKTLSRKDSLLRHQRQYCKVIGSRYRITQNGNNNYKRDVKSKIPIISSNVLHIILEMIMNDHRQSWKNDFEELKNALLTAYNADKNLKV